MTTQHTFADGKYTVINDNGNLTALRHGEPWTRDFTGDNLVYWMLVEVERLKAALAALAAKDEPVAWSEDFDAMPFNTYCKAIVDWYSHSRDGDSFLEGRDVEVIVVKYESGKGEYDTVFIHEGNKQYAYTRCEVSKWKPLYAHPFKE